MSLKSWGHALPFDGEIKDLVPLKSGPLLTSLIAVIAILCTLLRYHLQTHYTYTLHVQGLLFEREVKKECLVGFNRREAGREAGFCFTTAGVCSEAGNVASGCSHSSSKGSLQPDFTHLHTFASTPELLLRKEQDTSNKQIKDLFGRT